MKQNWSHYLILLALFAVLPQPAIAQEVQPEPVVAQVRITATPIRVPLPTQPPSATDIAIATPTPSITPTETGPLLIQVPAETTEINVRAEPDIESQRLGVIRANERYVVTGRYFSWLRINYDASPTGRGWVFGQLVTVLGDENEIPEIDPFNTANPLLDTTDTTIQSNQPSDTTTQGDDRTIVLPTADGVQITTDRALPTFTPVGDDVVSNPNLPAPNVEPEEVLEDDIITSALATITDSEIPPIVPISLLGVGGMLGILIVILRR